MCRAELLNFRGRSIQQMATVGSNQVSSPYTAAGLRGDGQIAAVADTGLDINSCYFYDPKGHVPFSDISSPVYDLKYRKVIQYTYATYSDTSDVEGGHGTHVSGIVTGCINNADINGGKSSFLFNFTRLPVTLCCRRSVRWYGTQC